MSWMRSIYIEYTSVPHVVKHTHTHTHTHTEFHVRNALHSFAHGWSPPEEARAPLFNDPYNDPP
jgi:hypothetical protein